MMILCIKNDSKQSEVSHDTLTTSRHHAAPRRDTTSKQ